MVQDQALDALQLKKNNDKSKALTPRKALIWYDAPMTMAQIAILFTGSSCKTDVKLLRTPVGPSNFACSVTGGELGFGELFVSVTYTNV